MIKKRYALLAAMIVAAGGACRPVTTTAPPAPVALPPALPPADVGALAAEPTIGVGIATLTFDRCVAPTTTQMAAWQQSPYRAVGIYIGGANAACKPSAVPHLNAGWVETVGNQGWRLLPLWVGRQAPCSGYTVRISSDPNTAFSQGAAEADDAANAAASFGIGPATARSLGSPIYFDLEHYTADQACRNAVRSFVSGWVGRLHTRGYQAGFYSSGSSGIADEVAVVTQGLWYLVPDDLWFAHWNGVASAYGSPYVPDTPPYWVHRRHHQYLGGTNPDGTPRYETYGGVTLNIDSNASDGLAAQRAFYRDPTWPLPPKWRS